MNFARQILKGKTIARALFNAEVERSAKKCNGRVLDLASGDASYTEFLPANLVITKTDLQTKNTNKIIDFNDRLPFDDGSFNNVFFFNALYIVRDPIVLMREIRRVLKPGGTALIASPFMQNEMREPHDYHRLTSEGLEELFKEAGFSDFEIHSYGERFTAAANLLHPFWFFSIIRLPVYTLACILDRAIPTRVRQNHPSPLGYFCTLTN